MDDVVVWVLVAVVVKQQILVVFPCLDNNVPIYYKDLHHH